MKGGTAAISSVGVFSATSALLSMKLCLPPAILSAVSAHTPRVTVQDPDDAHGASWPGQRHMGLSPSPDLHIGGLGLFQSLPTPCNLAFRVVLRPDQRPRGAWTSAILRFRVPSSVVRNDSCTDLTGAQVWRASGAVLPVLLSVAFHKRVFLLAEPDLYSMQDPCWWTGYSIGMPLLGNPTEASAPDSVRTVVCAGQGSRGSFFQTILLQAHCSTRLQRPHTTHTPAARLTGGTCNTLD